MNLLIQKINKYPGVLLTVVFLFSQLLVLPSVGMTWDEPSSFFFGRAMIRYYQTGDRGYLTDSEYWNAERFSREPFQYIYGEDVYPPFPFIVASLTSLVFAENVGLLSSPVAHHLGLLLLNTLGVYGMYRVGLLLGFSKFTAVLVMLLYATYPSLLGHMRNDAKDGPVVTMVVLTVWSFLSFVQHSQRPSIGVLGRAILTGIVLGLAGATKPTTAIMVPILGLWFVLAKLIGRKQISSSIPVVGMGVSISGIVALVTMILAWPWLWDDPVGRLWQVWSFFQGVGMHMLTLYFGQIYKAGLDLPWHYPLGILSVQTPESTLILFILGIVMGTYLVVKKRNMYALLCLVWIVIGMGRFFVPGVLIYAKVRHFIDVMPAFFLLIGVLLNYRVNFNRVVKKIVVSLAVAALIQQLYISLTHMPYEPSYFNSLVGGTRNAAEKRLFDVEYWASGVRDAMVWIDKQHTEDEPALVYACAMAHLALFYETPRVKVTSVPERAQYTIVPNSASWFSGALNFLSATHETAYIIERQGAPLFYVFKHTVPIGWRCGWETKMIYERP